MPLVENNDDDDDDDDDDSSSDLYESDIVQCDDEHVKVRRPSKKLLTKNRLVHDIESSLNEECYNDIHFINGKGQWETLTGYLGPTANKNTKSITWTSDFPTKGRQRACDIHIGDNPGTPLGAARNIDTIEDAKEHLFESSKYPYLGKSPLEMRALIGFMYLRGQYGLNHHKVDILFSNKTCPPIFGAIFSRNRVKFLLASISFISRDESIKNFPEDIFASCRVVRVIQCNCSKYLVPMLYMTIDETLYPMRPQIAFRQYNPN